MHHDREEIGLNHFGGCMKTNLKAAIFAKFGTQEKFCKALNAHEGFVMHDSKLSRYINDYVTATETEKKMIMRTLGIKESKKAMDDLFKSNKEDNRGNAELN